MLCSIKKCATLDPTQRKKAAYKGEKNVIPTVRKKSNTQAANADDHCIARSWQVHAWCTVPKPHLLYNRGRLGRFLKHGHEDAQPTLLPALPKARKDSAGNITVSTYETIKDQMREIMTAEHDFKTLVFDANTSMSRLLESEVALRDGVNTVADAAGGFHKGYTELAQMHAEIVYMASCIRKKRNMAVVFLGHLGTEKVKNRPDDASQYNVYSLDMHHASAAVYVSQSDGGYLHQKSGVCYRPRNKPQGANHQVRARCANWRAHPDYQW